MQCSNFADNIFNKFCVKNFCDLIHTLPVDQVITKLKGLYLKENNYYIHVTHITKTGD